MADHTLKKSTRWPAPAKLNLFLHITGRRADGYHNLQTVFQFVDYADVLDFHIRNDGQIRRVTTNPQVDAKDDLVVRAARGLKESVSSDLGVDIHVKKCIPMGAGLGGGSSDAATTLLALNRLWGLGCSNAELAQLGLSLGADVPIFVHGHAAWAEGVGETFTPIEPDQPWYLIVNPGCAVSTAEIFSAPELTRDTPALKMRAFRAGVGGNDCEATVRGRYPQVAAALDWLGPDQGARLTGTGACVFRPFLEKEQAQQMLTTRPHPWTGFVAKGLNRSPVLTRLSNEPDLL